MKSVIKSDEIGFLVGLLFIIIFYFAIFYFGIPSLVSQLNVTLSKIFF